MEGTRFRVPQRAQATIIGSNGPSAPSCRSQSWERIGAGSYARAGAGVRDAWAMTTYRVTYQGPPSLAVETATKLADAEGIELTASAMPPDGRLEGGDALLTLTVEGAPHAVAAAVEQLRAGLPPGATITLEDGPA